MSIILNKFLLSIGVIGVSFLSIQASFAKTEIFSPNWQLQTQEESGSCDYILTHIDATKKLHLKSDLTGKHDMGHCSAVVAIEPHAVSPSIALIDAPSERGGLVTIVLFKNNHSFTKVISYESPDEDSLNYKLAGNQLKLSTKTWKKTVILQNNGKIIAK